MRVFLAILAFIASVFVASVLQQIYNHTVGPSIGRGIARCLEWGHRQLAQWQVPSIPWLRDLLRPLAKPLRQIAHFLRQQVSFTLRAAIVIIIFITIWNRYLSDKPNPEQIAKHLSWVARAQMTSTCLSHVQWLTGEDQSERIARAQAPIVNLGRGTVRDSHMSSGLLELGSKGLIVGPPPKREGEGEGWILYGVDITITRLGVATCSYLDVQIPDILESEARGKPARYIIR